MKVVKDTKSPLEIYGEQRNEKKQINWRSVFIKGVLTVVTIFAGLWMWMSGIRIRYAVIPFLIHLCLLFYTFAVKFYRERDNERWWKAYVKKYGNENGEIPVHTRLLHKKLVEKGGQIDLS